MGLKIGIGAVALAVVLGLVVLVQCVSISNEEIGIRNTITQKQRDNMNEFDNMWKVISQNSQVAKADRDSLMKLFNGYAEARKTGGDNQIMTWVKESVPNVDSSTFKTLMNTITAARNSWTMRQKEILQLKVQHDNLLMKWPGSWILSGRQPIEVTIVTSDKTEKAFESGSDNDTDLGL